MENGRNISYFRNFVFGVEDSLVSTVGLLSGVAIAGVSQESLLVTGAVLICVEAISMAAGSFLSESSAEDMRGRSDSFPYVAAFVMFGSYFISGFIPLAPYLFLPVETAFSVSIVVSIAALMLLGVLSGSLSRTSILKSAMRMAIVGGLAIAAGAAVGGLLGL